MADAPFPPPLDEGLPEEIHNEHVLGLKESNVNVAENDAKVKYSYFRTCSACSTFLKHTMQIPYHTILLHTIPYHIKFHININLTVSYYHLVRM